MKLNKKQSGQGMTEYILIVALIALAVIGAVKMFSGNVSTSFQTVGGQITGNTTGNAAVGAVGSVASGAVN